MTSELLAIILGAGGTALFGLFGAVRYFRGRARRAEAVARAREGQAAAERRRRAADERARRARDVARADVRRREGEAEAEADDARRRIRDDERSPAVRFNDWSDDR